MPIRPSLRWLEEPAPGSGIRHYCPDGRWDFRSYPELALRARRAAGGLVRAGVRRDDRVMVVSGATTPDFVAAFYGVLWAGATVSVLAPPLSLQGPGHAGQVLAAVSALEPTAVVAGRNLREHVVQLLGDMLTVPVLCPGELTGDGDAVTARPSAELALIQFTSGTSNRPKGVRIPFDALEANTAAIRDWLQVGPADEWATWLPMHHDMGLVGCLISPVTAGNGLWLTEPAQFVRDPLPYLRCFGAASATITAMPGFGLDRIIRKVPREALGGLDFSGWRAIVVGAERIDPQLLRRFEELLAPYGLDPAALTPAYGLAEATLAVTGVPVRRRWVDAQMPGPAGAGAEPRGVLGCGLPVGDFAVRVVDDVGTPLPEGVPGEVEVSGSSLADGYLDGPVGAAQLREDAMLTGDAGFLLDGELYVLGRLGDSVKVRGRSVFAEDVESVLREAGGAPHRLAVVLGERAGAPVAVVVLEEPDQRWVDRAVSLLRGACAGAAVAVLAAPAGTIPQTTSGKSRRRELWHAFMSGELGAWRARGTSATNGSLGFKLMGDRIHNAAI